MPNLESFYSVRTISRLLLSELRYSLVQFWDNNLRITVDCSLNFSLFICDVCKKSSQRIGVIMRSRSLHTK